MSQQNGPTRKYQTNSNGFVDMKEQKNPYLDSDIVNASQTFSPNNNTAFIQRHSPTQNGISCKVHTVQPSDSNSSEFVVVNDEKKNYEITTYHDCPLYSMESGLHSLLQSMNFPLFSEVLITALIAPSIIRVIELNGLIPKQINIDLETMEPTTKIQEFITDKTKLIIIGHLFSFSIHSNIPNVLIIEDCSQRYKCDESEWSDIKIYKMQTKHPLNLDIMNGAMFKFKDKTLMQKVKNVTNCYSKQSVLMYLYSLIIYYLLSIPFKYKFIIKTFLKICCFLSVDYEQWFLPKMNTKQFLRSLEIQPSSYLIQRIKNHKYSKQSISKKQKQQKREILISMLSDIKDKNKNNDIVIVGKSCNLDSAFSAFPVIIKNKKMRERVVTQMRSYGYNVNDGKHQIVALSFISNVVYLPFNNMDSNEFKKMVLKLKEIINGDRKNLKKNILFYYVSIIIKISIILFVFKYIWFYLLIVMFISYYWLKPNGNFKDRPYSGIKQKRIVSKHAISVIITGCTGFVGEVLVKDLLDSYSCDQIKIYLMIRRKKKLSPIERAKEIFGDQYMKKNVFVIDAELETFNIDDIMNEIGSESKITHIIHCAAVVKFIASHSSIAKTNILCTLKMKELATKYSAKFIYISTAFVQTNNIDASPVRLHGDIDANKLYECMLRDDVKIDEYLEKYQIENNYILSKIIAENLIGSTSIIIRPSIVSPSWNYPEPGWGGRSPSTITLICALIAGRLVRCPPRFSMFRQESMPIIPVDFVTKCIIENMHSNDNTIHLAAFNTGHKYKYNKVSSFYEIAFILTSYLYSIETLCSFECVLIRCCTVLSSLSRRLFVICCFLFNELFAAQKYKQSLSVIHQYHHFTFNSFHVQNGITPNIEFDGKQYITMIIESACNLAQKPIFDLTATIPIFKYDENIMISITNTVFSWILSKTTNKVIVENAEKLKLLNNQKNNILLLPTHRSFYDFLIICKICIKYKMYGLSMPSSFATSKFKQSPLIAMSMKIMNVIFIDSSSNNIKNGVLKKKIKQKMHCNNVYQLFLEGTRSRNRRFLKPFHGALSCLAEMMDLCIVPITINYEKIPEQNSFFRELDAEKCSFSVIALIGWFYDVFIQKNVFLGDINIKIGDFMEIKQRKYNKEYFVNLTKQIQAQQMKMVNITKYHIRHYAKYENIEKRLIQKGCTIYPSSIIDKQPMNDKEIYVLTMQFIHYLDEENDDELMQSIKSMMNRYKKINKNKNKKSVKRIIVKNESLGYWGYSDSYFVLKENKLFLKGSRYEISDKYFDKTISFLSQLSDIPLLRKKNCFPVNINGFDLNEDDEKDEDLMTFLIELFGENNVSKDIALRYRHGTGHTVSDMLHLRVQTKSFRIPDIVIYPTSKQQIVVLVQNAMKFNIGLIPFGGGTNVTHALRCNLKEKRKIISVDMSFMNKLIWINRENQTANIQTGITGKKLENELNEMGLTTGHYPDSFEFSTLGGWIATFASGMKRSKYGNIEEIVLDFEVITSHGLINRNFAIFGRISSGTNYLSQFYGSEGNLGIIVSAVIRVHKLPDIIKYDSIVFPNWSKGLNFIKMMKNVPTNGRPATLRFVDNVQFKLSQTLKSKTSFLSKLYVTKWCGFNVDKICAATIVYEGNKNEIKMQEQIIHDLIKQNNGIRGGASSGKAGFHLTFAIAYLRDFLLENFGILAESFETFVPYDKLDGFKQNLHSNILIKHRNMGLIGNPFLSSRISQIYNEGVCLYLYYGFFAGDDGLNKNSFNILHEMEEFIRTEMLKYGGSISHHHGVGKIRSHIFRNQIASKQFIELAKNVKNAFDPNNIFCANNGLLDDS